MGEVKVRVGAPQSQPEVLVHRTGQVVTEIEMEQVGHGSPESPSASFSNLAPTKRRSSTPPAFNS